MLLWDRLNTYTELEWAAQLYSMGQLKGESLKALLSTRTAWI